MPRKRKPVAKKYPPNVSVDPMGPRLIQLSEETPSAAGQDGMRWASLACEALTIWEKTEQKAKATAAPTTKKS